ncbi:MAG: GGDEF domain-containing protein [Lachnospiraceae bacterium]|nr:GGDEF domain-containing protein [Lachnospiraceae bacterium]
MSSTEITKQDLLAALLSAPNIKYFWKDTKRRFVGASQSFLDYYGFSSLDAILGKTDEDMGWHIDPEPFKQDERTVIKEGVSLCEQHRTCIIKGKVRHISATKMPILNEKKEICGLVGFFEDITETYNEKKKLKKAANTDTLTGLLNRTGLAKVLDEYIYSYENGGMDFVVYYLDINDFKTANETYGHSFGDQVLVGVADSLVRNMGSDSVIARLGGALFVIVHQLAKKTKHVAINRSVLTLEDKIRNSVESINYIGEHTVKLSVSSGFSAYSEHKNIDKVLATADVNMLEDKRSRRRT